MKCPLQIFAMRNTFIFNEEHSNQKNKKKTCKSWPGLATASLCSTATTASCKSLHIISQLIIPPGVHKINREAQSYTGQRSIIHFLSNLFLEIRVHLVQPSHKSAKNIWLFYLYNDLRFVHHRMANHSSGKHRVKLLYSFLCQKLQFRIGIV